MEDIFSSFDKFSHFILKPVMEFIHDIGEATAFVKALWDLKLAAEHLKPIDDRSFVLQKLLFFLAQLPEDSLLVRVLNYILILVLWKQLPHADTSHKPGDWYRQPDGSNNNTDRPEIG